MSTERWEKFTETRPPAIDDTVRVAVAPQLVGIVREFVDGPRGIAQMRVEWADGWRQPVNAAGLGMEYLAAEHPGAPS